MLENTNDYMAFLMIILAAVAVIAFALNMISLRLTAKHLEEEANYYSKDKKGGKYSVYQSNKTK